MNNNNHITSIDFGTSKIVGIVGRKTPDGTIVVLATDEISTNGSVRRGVVVRPDEVKNRVIRILSNLNLKLQELGEQSVSHIFIPINGQSLKTVFNTESSDLGKDEVVTQQDLDTLLDLSRNKLDATHDVLMIKPFEYILDDCLIENPIGERGDKLECKHIAFIARRELQKGIKNVVNQIPAIKEVTFIPACYANGALLLTDAERKSGAAILELGAGVSTFSVFKNNKLQSFFTIPFGGINITQDIMTLNVSFDEAERVKEEHGKAIMNNEDGKIDIEASENNTGTPFLLKLTNITAFCESRLNEIFVNIKQRMDLYGYTKDYLREGIIITGGTSQVNNIRQLIEKVFKVEHRKGSVSTYISTKSPYKYDLSISYSASLGIILEAASWIQKTDCATKQDAPPAIPERQTLFGDEFFDNVAAIPTTVQQSSTSNLFTSPSNPQSNSNSLSASKTAEKQVQPKVDPKSESQSEKKTEPKKSRSLGLGNFMKFLGNDGNADID